MPALEDRLMTMIDTSSAFIGALRNGLKKNKREKSTVDAKVLVSYAVLSRSVPGDENVADAGFSVAEPQR